MEAEVETFEKEGGQFLKCNKLCAFLLQTTCNRSWCNGRASCVAAKITKKKYLPNKFFENESHNQLPLLRLRTQTTTYIPSHLHLNNSHTYTPYAERYCPSFLPLQIPGNETHTLPHCPYFSPLTQPAIQSLMLNLWRFNLWAWATYTDPQKVAMLLGGISPKLDRQHEKTLVVLTSPTCTQLIRKIHSLHSSLLISQTTIVVFKINSSYIFFQNYYLTILKLLQ